MKELRTLLPYFRPYRKGVVAGLALVVISNLFTVATPYLVKLAIDGLGDPEVTAARITAYALLIVGVAILGGAEHLLRLDAAFYGSVPPATSWRGRPTTPWRFAWPQARPSCTR